MESYSSRTSVFVNDLYAIYLRAFQRLWPEKKVCAAYTTLSQGKCLMDSDGMHLVEVPLRLPISQGMSRFSTLLAGIAMDCPEKQEMAVYSNTLPIGILEAQLRLNNAFRDEYRNVMEDPAEPESPLISPFINDSFAAVVHAFARRRPDRPVSLYYDFYRSGGVGFLRTDREIFLGISPYSSAETALSCLLTQLSRAAFDLDLEMPHPTVIDPKAMFADLEHASDEIMLAWTEQFQNSRPA